VLAQAATEGIPCFAPIRGPWCGAKRERTLKKIVVTGAQQKALLILSRKDIAAIRKNPKLVSGSKHLLLACKRTIKKVGAIPQYASRKKRETAYKRIVALCQKAIDSIET
jgi:hypothetical protein